MIAMESRKKKEQKMKKKSLFVLMKSKGKTFPLDLSITDYKSVTLFIQKAMIIYNVNKRILYCLCFNSY